MSANYSRLKYKKKYGRSSYSGIINGFTYSADWLHLVSKINAFFRSVIVEFDDLSRRRNDNAR